PRRWDQVSREMFCEKRRWLESPVHRLFDSHIFQPQSGAVFDAAEVFEADAHYLRARLSVVGGPSTEPSDDPGGEGECAFGMWILLLRCGPFKLKRHGFEDGLIIRLESLGEVFVGRAVTGTNQLHDGDCRNSSCGDEFCHDLGIADVGFLDIKASRFE